MSGSYWQLQMGVCLALLNDTYNYFRDYCKLSHTLGLIGMRNAFPNVFSDDVQPTDTLLN